MSSIVQHAPRFSEQDAVGIACDLFSLEVSARQLPSERDQNFLQIAADGKSYVLKLANSTERREVLDFQNQAMIHIAGKRNIFDKRISVVPDVIATTEGEQITEHWRG
jgi:Ser/Thr protein kinase RdoA (MazF antagonist)